MGHLFLRILYFAFSGIFKISYWRVMKMLLHLDFLCLDLQLHICVATCTHWAAWCPSSTADTPKAPWSWSWATGWTTAGTENNRIAKYFYFFKYFFLFNFNYNSVNPAETWSPICLQVQGSGLWPRLAELLWPEVWAVACSAHHQPQGRTVPASRSGAAGPNTEIDTHQVSVLCLLNHKLLTGSTTHASTTHIFTQHLPLMRYIPSK